MRKPWMKNCTAHQWTSDGTMTTETAREHRSANLRDARTAHTARSNGEIPILIAYADAMGLSYAAAAARAAAQRARLDLP